VLPAARVAEAHDLVHRLGGGDAVVDDPERFAQERVLQPIPDESRHVALHEHRSLAAGGDGGTGEFDGLGTAERAGDDLDQGHQQRRVPVVRADRALGRAARVADLTDRERRRVAGDHCGGKRNCDRREHRALDREVLGHRLDDEVAALDGLQRRSGGHALRGRLGGRLVVQAESQRRVERRVDAGAGVRGMAREAMHAVPRERVLGGDLRTHQPGTYDDDIHQRRS